MPTLHHCFLPLLVALLSLGARAQILEPFPEFPKPAPGSFAVVGTALPEGRLVVWNGDTVFLQQAVNGTLFTPIAAGYAGDPAFILYEPSRESLLLGAGFSGDIYRVDLAQPADFSPAALVVNAPHYSGVLLTDSLLLVDAGKPGFAGSELSVLDISGAKSSLHSRVIVQAPPLPKDLVVEKPPFTYSAPLALDADNGIVYAMSTYGSPEELRFFSVSDLLTAYAMATPLDWGTDGTLVGSAGQFNNGGVAGIQANGLLIMPGFGSVQFVDPVLANPASASIENSYDPTGLGLFYSVIFNPVTDVMLVVDGAGNAYAPPGVLVELPALGVTGLLVLGGAIAGWACRRARV